MKDEHGSFIPHPSSFIPVPFGAPVPLGTLINIAAIIAGTLTGTFIGARLSPRLRETATAVVGIVTLVMGIKLAVASHSILLMLVSLLLGALFGEWWRLDERLESFGHWIEARFTPPQSGAASGESLSRAFVTASLIFTVGPMTIIGSIQDGVDGRFELIAIKSMLDMITSVTLASTLGWGVGLSVISIFVIQGGISLLARYLGSGAAGIFSDGIVMAERRAIPLGEAMIDEMSAAGGILMIAIALLLLDIKRPRVVNLLPALVIAPALVFLFCRLRIPIAP
jgi:uncharacterized protein